MCLCAHVHTHTNTLSEDTGWGAVWNCYVAAAYELTQMVSPSATKLTHLSHWVSNCLCALQCQCVVAYVCGHVRECVGVSAWCWENCLAPLHFHRRLPLRSLPVPVKLLYSDPHNLDYWIVINANTKWHLSGAKDGNWSCGIPTKAGLIAEKIVRVDGWEIESMRNRMRTKDKASFHHHITSHQ